MLFGDANEAEAAEMLSRMEPQTGANVHIQMPVPYSGANASGATEDKTGKGRRNSGEKIT